MAEQKSIGALMVAQRYAKMTPEERSAAAKNAADKRWAAENRKPKKAAGKTAGKKTAGTVKGAKKAGKK